MFIMLFSNFRLLIWPGETHLVPPSPSNRCRCKQASLTGVFGLLWGHSRNSKWPLWFAVMSTDTKIFCPMLYLQQQIAVQSILQPAPPNHINHLVSTTSSPPCPIHKEINAKISFWKSYIAWHFHEAASKTHLLKKKKDLRTITPRPKAPPPSWGRGEGASQGSPHTPHLPLFSLHCTWHLRDCLKPTHVLTWRENPPQLNSLSVWWTRIHSIINSIFYTE